MGTRLRSVVSDRPKVLARVCNRPFITFLLDQLIAARTKEVILCTGFRAGDIQKELGNSYRSLNIVHSTESEPLGTGGALRLALPLINTDTVLIMNGDSFVNVELTAYMEWFFQKERQASLLLVKVPDTGRYGKVIVDNDERITAFKEKSPDSGPGLINAGIYLIKKPLVASIPAAIPYSLERQFFPGLIQNGIYGFYSNCNFIDIGTPDSYVQAQELFSCKNQYRSENRINGELKETDP